MYVYTPAPTHDASCKYLVANATPFDFYFTDWYILHIVILIGDWMVKSGLNQHRFVPFSPMGIDSADNSLLAYGEICIDKSHFSPINPAQQKYRYSSVPIEAAVLVRKRTTFLLQACFSAEAGMLLGTRLWAYTRRGQLFCFKLPSLQSQECLDPPLGLHRRRAAFLLQACFSAEAGMLLGTRLWAYTRRGQLFCFKLPSLQRQESFPGLASGLTQEEDSLSAAAFSLSAETVNVV
jgi:hypothetical protein